MEEDDSNKRTSKSEHQDGGFDKNESQEQLVKNNRAEYEDGQSTADPTGFNRVMRSNKIAPSNVSSSRADEIIENEVVTTRADGNIRKVGVVTGTERPPSRNCKETFEDSNEQRDTVLNANHGDQRQNF